MTTATLTQTTQTAQPAQPSTPIVVSQRPTRWNSWEMRQQIYCCGKWWNGSVCLYGSHKLK